MSDFLGFVFIGSWFLLSVGVWMAPTSPLVYIGWGVFAAIIGAAFLASYLGRRSA